MSIQHQSKFVNSLDGKPLFVQIFTANSSHTQDIVILHGMGGDSNATIDFIFQLITSNSHLRCFTIDQRFHGKSTHITPQKSSQLEMVLADDLQALCTQLNISNPIFIGHSLGTIAIQTFLQRNLQPHPKACVLISPPLNIPFANFPFRHFFYQLLIFYTRHHTFTTTTRSVTEHRHFKDSHDFNPLRILHDLICTNPIQLCLLYLAILGWTNRNIHQYLHNKKFHIVYGQHDKISPVSKKIIDLANQYPKQFHLIDSNHHQPFSKYPALLSQIVLKVIES